MHSERNAHRHNQKIPLIMTTNRNCKKKLTSSKIIHAVIHYMDYSKERNYTKSAAVVDERLDAARFLLVPTVSP